ncbi:Subunit of heteropentameric Replication factor C (RF-C) [Perkinsus olseni]|uniref:Subunit of heteropentameric Replication factor C (RF-C) n=1 Tax=Perkinsus olseni TaxID=32597 RepID=A0A7J6PQM2_PEROL|nr:Subunit of heteropentameric Replication factor C (RF-C) [Perkinsus olseni]
MSFLVDTERPQKLDELTFHPSLTRTLKKLAASKDCPHLLFYGPSGGGKMTRIRCLLEGMFGPGAEKTSTSFRQFKATTSTTVDIQVVVSAFHVEVTPSDVGIRDAAVIQQLIKQMAENPPVGEVPFHVVVINDAHCLTRQAQAALRRTMEKDELGRSNGLGKREALVEHIYKYDRLAVEQTPAKFLDLSVFPDLGIYRVKHSHREPALVETVA